MPDSLLTRRHQEVALKIHILYEFTEGPWGGGNQFLKALREHFSKGEVYSERPEDAEVILFNSHHCSPEVLKAKTRFRNQVFVHRVDGPISYVRGRDRLIDASIHRINNLVADGTVFQSLWSREKNYDIGMTKAPYEAVIMNAPDPSIFHPGHHRPLGERKVRLVGTSWSGNIRKGFDIYGFLDDNLDFSRYEMTFVGNSPIQFKNIRHIEPVPSAELAAILREHDIYVIASRNDPCSNALLETLHCGLPAVARNDGGHPQIVDEAGELFQDEKDVIEAIERVAQNHAHYRQRIRLPSLDEVGQEYYEFARTIYEDYLRGDYRPKQVSPLRRFIKWDAQSKLQAVIERL